MLQFDAIETHYKNVFEVWQTDTDTGAETQVEAHIDGVAWVPDSIYGDTVYYVKEGVPEGDFHLARFLAPHHFSTLGAAVLRVESLVAADMVGLHYGD